MIALAGFVAWGCSSVGSDPADTTPPMVVSRSVQNGETDVGLIERFDIQFSEPMDPATIVFPNIYVAGRGPVGYVEYDPASRTASFIPDTLYSASAAQLLVISGEVADDSGNALGVPDTTEFETGPFDCGHLADYFEPNESIAQATPIELDRTYRTLATCGIDEDFYSFALTETALVAARTTFSHADSAPWQMRYQEGETGPSATLVAAAVTGETVSFQYIFPPGAYNLRVSSEDDEEMILYDLLLETGVPPPSPRGAVSRAVAVRPWPADAR